MAVPSSLITSPSLADPTDLGEMVPATQHALELFPSEYTWFPAEAEMSSPPPRPAVVPRTGVVMRVEPLSRGAAWALAAILLAGAGSVAAIGVLLVGRA